MVRSAVAYSLTMAKHRLVLRIMYPKDNSMTLPKPKKKKLIKTRDFIRVAKKVEASLKEEKNYLLDKYSNGIVSLFVPHS